MSKSMHAIPKVKDVHSVLPREWNRGIDSEHRQYLFLTNFFDTERPLYEIAIKTWSGSEEFGISEVAFSGTGQRLYSTLGLYVRPTYITNLNGFWSHFTATQVVQNLRSKR